MLSAMRIGLLSTGFVLCTFGLPAVSQVRIQTMLQHDRVVEFPGNGAICDGKTDDALAINASLAKLNGGGLAYIAPDSFCLIGGGDLLIPPNVRVEGLSGPNATNPNYNTGSGLVIMPGRTIVLSNGSSIENVIVKRLGLVPSPSVAQVISAVASWGVESSVGITIPRNITGVSIEHLFVIGFNTCLKSYSGGFSISHIWGDCYNGIEVSSAGDNHYIDDVRFEPIYSLHLSPDSGSWARPGTGFYLHDGNTGGVISRAFSFMYANGVLLDRIGVTQIVNSGWEWQPSMGNGTNGTVGIRWINHNSQTTVSNSYFNGFDTPLSVESTGEVVISGASVGSASATGFYLGGATSSGAEFTITGAVTGSDKCALVVSAMSALGHPIQISYTASRGDTVDTVGSGLAKLVNQSQALIAARFFAVASDGVVSIFWPKGIIANVVAKCEGGLQYRSAVAPARAGSYGAIIAPNIEFKNVPAFTFGMNVNHWLIDAPYLTAYKNWITAPSESRISDLTVRAVTYAHSKVSDLAECGDDPGIDEDGTDEAGTITEGVGAEGCTYTFTVPFYKAPYCIVSSPTGSATFGYSASSDSLVIANPRQTHAVYTYRCQP